MQWSSAQTYGTHVLISPHRSPNEPLQKLIWQAHCIQFPICHPRYWEPHCVPSECRAGMDRPDGKHSTLETNYWPRIQSDARRRRTVDSIVELPGQGEMFAGINTQFSTFVNEVEGNPYLKLYNTFSTWLHGPSASSASMQFLSFLHALNPWILGEENVEGTKEQYRLLPTSWGRRHITLTASVNISLTPILLLLEHLPSPVSSPPSQPTTTQHGPFYLHPTPQALLPGGLFVSLPGAQAVEHWWGAQATVKCTITCQRRGLVRLPYLLFNLAALIHAIKTLSH